MGGAETERALAGENRSDESLRYPQRPEHPGTAQLIAYWHTKRAVRPMPDRADIAPGELAGLLPNIVISEVLRDGEDFRVRIFGTALVELVGEERTGKCLSEFGVDAFIPTKPERVQSHWFDVTRRSFVVRHPVLVSGTMASSNRSYISWHGVSMPLTSGGSEVAQMLGGIFVVDAGCR